MPLISGNLFFDSSLNNTGTVPIVGVPIVLQNTSTGDGLVVLTSATGAFQFDDVPAGSYILVESWGFPGGVASPASFNNAAAISTPVGEDPPASQITSPPANTNLILSVTRNTIPITMGVANITGQIFRDGPYTNKPLAVNDVTYVGSNLITAAANGTWGTLPAGTAVDTRPATAPYPGVVPGFTYSSATPNDGSYTVTNIMNVFGQGFVADHTQGDETGRYQIVNGANPGNSFFTETVNVTPNKYYQFSAWMLNLTAGALPQLGYQIKTTGGAVIFQENAPAVSLTTPRTWLELGTFFTPGNNSQIVINFLSQGPAAGGNDYAMDDFLLIQASINDILTASKTVSKDFANIGDVLDYEVVFKNTGNSTITNMVFIDTIPSGTTFNTGTVRVNGTTVPSANPNSFTIPTPPLPISPGEVVTVNYKVTVNTIPSPNPIPNSATANYAFAPEDGGTTVPNAVSSNTVTTQVNNGDITSRKLVDKSFAKIGDIVTYTIPIANIGNTTTNNITLIDTIPTGTTFVPDSLSIDNVPQAGLNPSPPLGASVGTLPAGGVSTISFKVLVVTIPTPNPFTNNASFNYSFVVDPVTLTSANSGTNTNAVSTKVNQALLTERKIVDKAYANVGDTLVYTVVLTNSGNVTANQVTFVDTIPNDTSLVAGTFKQDGSNVSGSPTPPGVTLPNAVGPGKVSTVTFNVKVNTIPCPNPIPNSASGVYVYTVDPANPNADLSSLNSNQVATTINNANLGNITKAVDKAFATCGDVVTYTIVVPNSGNVDAFNVIIKDTIPNGATFKTDTVVVNGTTINGVNPLTGVNIGTISAGTVSTMTFQVSITC